MSCPSPPRPGAQDTDLREVQVRAITFAVLLLLILGLLMARLAKRQIVEAGEWRQKAISQQTPIRSVSAYRGDIRTRDGKVLARSVRTRSAFAEPRRFGQRTRTRRGVTIEPTTQADRERVAHTIGEALGQDARQIRELADRFANPRRQAFCWVERRLDDQRALALEQARLRGVGFQTEYRRTYPCGTLAAHVLGFTGLEASGALTGQSGVERGFDVYLKGIDGRREVVRDGQGDALLTEGNLLMAPIDGAEVTLTLDSRVQAIAERAALKGAEEWNPEGIAVVCLEPQTGRILALASWPSFDPADLNGLTEDKALREAEAQRLYGRSDASLDSEERAAVTKAVLERVTRNRPLMDPYEPGSTLKPLVAAAGVEIGAINPTERIDCAGPFRVAGKAVTDVHPHGALPLRGVISKSSNVGMVKIALRMGFEAVHTSLVGAGFGEPTGIGLAVEEKGRIPALADWKTYTSRSVAQGYALLVTPLQLASAFGALGTGGVRYTPQLVEKVTTPEGETLRRFRRKVASRVVDEHTAREVIVPALEDVVNEGTAKNVRLDEWQVAGKTGTAMKVINGRYENRYRSSFVGFAPSRDPQLLVLVMVDDPRSPDGRRPYGGTVAGPIAKEIFAESLPYLLK